MSVGGESPLSGLREEGRGERGAVGRRRFLQAVSASPLFLFVSSPATATPAAMAAAIRDVVGERPVREGRVTLDLPRIADNGNVVPLTVKVDSPMTADDHVRAIHVFSEENPVPTVVQLFLGPHCPKAEVGTRIRLARTQRVVAIAELSDGSCWSATAQVDVTISACGDD